MTAGSTITAPALNGAAPADGADGREPRESQASAMVRLARDSGAEFFHDGEGESYATVPVDKHLETLALKGGQAAGWLRRLYYQETSKAPGSQGVQDALNLLKAIAVFEGEQHEVHVRVAGGTGSIYLDLGDEAYRVVEITVAGWRVIQDAPVRFRRPRGMLPLPMPERGGRIALLREFLNVESEADFRLVVSWVVVALCPRGPYPVLSLEGEQGSAKTTSARVLRDLIDPNRAPMRTEPREVGDLMIAARNGWVVALDNLSSLRPWLSDALCRVSTGGAISKRELYTDADEVLIDVTRPVILTGIDGPATQGDLIDRTLRITQPSIRASARRPERTFRAEFEAARPRILGALLDALVLVLRDRDHVQLPGRPRMADFAEVAAAAAPAIGWTAEQFLAAYADNQAGARSSAVEASLVGVAVLHFMAERTTWEGTASELLAALAGDAGEKTERLRQWPKTPRALSGELRRLAPLLASSGIEAHFGDRQGKTRARIIRLEQVDETPSAPSASPPSGGTESEQADDRPPKADDALLDRPPQTSAGWSNPGSTRATTDGADGADGRLPAVSDEVERAEERRSWELATVGDREVLDL